jgi:CDP-paratose 2-epimerase
MKILITGGAGMVGSHTAEYYAKKGDDVVVLDNLMRSKLFGYDKDSVEYNWNYLKQYHNIALIKGDVRVESDILKAIGDGVDVCVHTAGQPGVPLSCRIPLEDFSINAFGTLNVLENLRKTSPKATFVYCSTNKVYGENVDTDVPVKESMSIDHTGHTPYGASKYVGDLYAQEYSRYYKMKTGVFRMSCIYGTRQFGFEDQGWVAHFVVSNLNRIPITIFGDGTQVRDLLYVDDLVEAYDAFINSDLKHGVFNTGGGVENRASLLEVIKTIEEETGIPMQYSFADWRPSDQKIYISDISKIRDTIGWSPKTGVREGLKRLIEWAKQ